MGLFIIAVLWFFAFIGTPIVASNKNRSALGWFGLAVLIGIFAFLLVLLLPALPDTSAIDAERTNTKECPHCRSRVPWNASVCRYCQRDLHMAVVPPPAPTPMIVQGGVIEGHTADCACRSCFMRRELLNRQAAQSKTGV